MALAGTGASFSFIPDDNATYVVTLKATDKDGGMGTANATILVTNVAPSMTITSPETGALYPINAQVAISGSFSDQGTTDTHTCTVNWDDSGSPTKGAINETNGSGVFNATKNYASAGVYTICVTINDDEGDYTIGSIMVVVYDPSGGFVTGDGWINSPFGAYASVPSLTGKAIFGFVSRYEKGANVPKGNTEFQFQVANFNFHSESYQWLVVAGAKAQYKGSGSVNNTPGYGFLLTATDGEASGGGGVDKFRIKIWDTNCVVYDNLREAS